MMRVFFFKKCLQFDLDFKNAEPNSQKVFRFLYNWISFGYVKMSLLTREYFSSAVNLLTNSQKIDHMTKSDFS